MADQGRTVYLDDRRESGSIEIATRDPARELIVPNTVVSYEVR